MGQWSPGNPKAANANSHVNALYIGFSTGALAGAVFEPANSSKTNYPMMLEGPDAQPDGLTNVSLIAVDSIGVRTGTIGTIEDYNTTGRPYYRVQAQAAGELRAWSEVYEFADSSTFGLTWTVPFRHGHNSSLRWVAAADVRLDFMSSELTREWEKLRQKLQGDAYNVNISHNESGVFIVNHVSERFREQEGVLIGASQKHALLPVSAGLTFADRSPAEAVALTSRMLMKKFGKWSSIALHTQTHTMTFDTQAAAQGILKECTHLDSLWELGLQFHCCEVGFRSVYIENKTRWLIVTFLPAGAFSRTIRKQSQEFRKRVEAHEEEYTKKITETSIFAGIIFVGLLICSICLGCMLGHVVSQPLKRLSSLMRRLSDLDFSQDSQEFDELKSLGQSSFKDVGELQDAFTRLAKSVEVFSRFVPDTVVKNIVRGDERSTRLHVSKREVTILFSDIEGFTSISEKLSQRDLLILLTRYFTVMTQIAEAYGGVVAEILGDGLLIYWNTPADVPDHATKACLAALAMQLALAPLNAELKNYDLPPISIRIGLHTGMVLSGNIGSEMKMKFGCMGDPVNLASRLEGLCKFYGVGILCSGAVNEALAAPAALVCRKLDLVQVKGRRDPTCIYEVIGLSENSSFSPVEETPSGGELDLEAGQEAKPDLKRDATRDSLDVSSPLRVVTHVMAKHSKPPRHALLLLEPFRRLVAGKHKSQTSKTPSGPSSQTTISTVTPSHAATQSFSSSTVVLPCSAVVSGRRLQQAKLYEDYNAECFNQDRPSIPPSHFEM
jgi:class 3 adenylate cyclase